MTLVITMSCPEKGHPTSVICLCWNPTGWEIFHWEEVVAFISKPVLIRVWKLCERSVKNIMSNCQFWFLTKSFCFDVPLLLLCFTSLVSFQCDWYRKNKWMNQYKFLVLSLSYYTLIFSFSWNSKWLFKHESGHMCVHMQP